VLKCFAGCKIDDICAALGIEKRDLFFNSHTRDTSRRSPRKRYRIVASYIYTDEQGNKLYKIVRYRPKTFKSFAYDSKSKRWRKGLEGVRRVPYRLDMMAANKSKTVVFTEGEKDADLVTASGLYIGSCIAGGANGPLPENFGAYFRGRVVILVPDCDPPGRAFMARVLFELIPNALSVYVFDLDRTRADGYDLSDWVKDGNSLEALDSCLSYLNSCNVRTNW